MGAFGFEVPTGDPAALTTASTNLRALGLALIDQGKAVTNASQVAIDGGGWRGDAASAFTAKAEEIIGVFADDAAACGNAATALSDLARALQQAQTAARQALADCQTSQTALDTHNQAAAQAGQEADTLGRQAATAPDPVSASHLSQQAGSALQRQTDAQLAAGRAHGDLTGAQTRGQIAVEAYTREAQAIAGRLAAAAAALKPAPPESKGWADGVVNWLGHTNDFSGAGAVGLAKGYDAAIALAGKRLASESQQYLKDPAAMEEVMAAFGPQFAGQSDPAWQVAESARGAANSLPARVLTKGVTADTPLVGKVLSKVPYLDRVPYLGMALTGADMYLNHNEDTYHAVIQPLGNLAIATTVTEVGGEAVAGGIASAAGTLAAGDGIVAGLAGSALVPGVGEVVIVGALTVGAVYAADKLGQAIWDHRAAIGHWFEHTGSTVLKDAKSVVHDLEPWNW